MSLLGDALHLIFPHTIDNIRKSRGKKSTRLAEKARIKEMRDKLKKMSQKDTYDKKFKKLLELMSDGKITDDDYQKSIDKLVIAYGDEKQKKALHDRALKNLRRNSGANIPVEEMDADDRKAADERRKQEKHELDIETKKKRLEQIGKKKGSDGESKETTQTPEIDQEAVDFYTKKAEDLMKAAQKVEAAQAVARKKANGDGVDKKDAVKELEHINKKMDAIERWHKYYMDLAGGIEDGKTEKELAKIYKKPNGDAPDAESLAAKYTKPEPRKSEKLPKKEEPAKTKETPSTDKETKDTQDRYERIKAERLAKEKEDSETKATQDRYERIKAERLAKEKADKDSEQTGSTSDELTARLEKIKSERLAKEKEAEATPPEDKPKEEPAPTDQQNTSDISSKIEKLKQKLDNKLPVAEDKLRSIEKRMRDLQRTSKNISRNTNNVTEAAILEAEVSPQLAKLQTQIERYKAWINYWKQLKIKLNKKGVTAKELLSLKKPEVSAPRPTAVSENEEYDYDVDRFFVEDTQVVVRNNMSWYC